jgi:hypothetical protein
MRLVARLEEWLEGWDAVWVVPSLVSPVVWVMEWARLVRVICLEELALWWAVLRRGLEVCWVVF